MCVSHLNVHITAPLAHQGMSKFASKFKKFAVQTEISTCATQWASCNDHLTAAD